MANRAFHPPRGHLEIGVVTLFAKATIGASGAPTLVASASKGVASITRNSAGQYALLLSDLYPAMLWATARLMNTADSDPSTVGVENRLVSETVSSTTPTVTYQWYASDDGADTDPANGATLYFQITLRNSSVV